MIKKILFTTLLTTSSTFGYAGEAGPPLFHHPLYIGVMGGYGSTTWQGLVPTEENQNLALSMSTPIDVTEGGGVWGVMAGYEFLSAFAVEFNYMRYPDAEISFDPMSLFSFENDNLVSFKTKTETLSLMAKIMLPINNSSLRLFSSAGAAGVHREDILVDDWRLSPTFAAGLNYRFKEHFMAELAGTYSAGYGESQLNPSNTYFPFLYAVTARLAYFF
ncbi:outer membrane beta-barrel protein [Legionella jordanis]|uniref:Outer membrane protein beta-barrel domain-containing protein n=1 Tax=Legionella jordanis TaxID=456 RepID=A0A0W0V7M8_9GAMM|nr:outer membrane beta-barrel protein [Legionella jordanis]KTD16090.1 hypothetical protein Ljor_0396 [Legionella jordanis]VEH12450.1 Uncharacterised protein [Legionella jordanis]